MNPRPAVRFAVAYALALLALSAFSPTGEVFLVLALLVLLAGRELAGRLLDARSRDRIDLLVGLGVLAFLAIVVRRVAEILR